MKKIEAYGVVLYTVEKDSIKILLCKSVKSRDKWGCLKGVKLSSETPRECARREFYEESSIKGVESYLFEDYFEQRNEEKNIGVWLVNIQKVANWKSYFFEDKLLDNYLSWENSKVKFFDIKKLPNIKKKQKDLIKQIKDFLQNKSQHR
ncbi:NUDIX domain-containing protein [Halarcobacter anaerophilus]|jgi:ADP-ribose pyrophosphatase YjhB (NUDIX family)|nr:NUDIX domain-containing protein [Halarcobacter anaerophilus]QDF28358.1 putative diadenosine tetraphosphate hydrolase [Halarcobacter anaerophilus]